MDNKTMYAVIGVVAVVIIAAAAIVLMGDDNEDDRERYNIQFLIEDGDYYKWAKGSGDSAVDAFEDAMDDADLDCEITSSGWVSTVMNKGTLDNGDGTYTYWVQFAWNGSAWEFSEIGLSNLPDTTEYYCFCYGVSAMTGPLDYPTHNPVE